MFPNFKPGLNRGGGLRNVGQQTRNVGVGYDDIYKILLDGDLIIN